MACLERIVLSSEVHMLCSSYALCTENEEVALLLLGDYVQSESSAASIAMIQTCFFVVRKDKRNDRVEISSEELSKALSEADSRGIKVIGWCHSHPKITISPSHVDLNTQHTLQLLDERFFGLIYSCFHVNQDLTQKIQVTAFQSLSDDKAAPGKMQ
ncbi:hypothetical protein BASA81_015148 [Batrachochytrium salamandrivorans]|nr:hypothetical protein BASA81_015148 [Batrachochytrium salamandrivorans]